MGSLLPLGLLSLLQVWVLPGALALVLMRRRRPLVESALLTASLSWLINHALVLALIAVGGHTRGVWLTLIAVEVGALVWLGRRALATPLPELLAPSLDRRWGQLAAMRAESPVALAALLPVALASLVVGALVGLRSIGEVFQGWDPVVSWNRWAIDWAAGQLPTLTWHYPQLFPSGWSISYALLGSDEVELFARAAMTPFALGIAVCLVDLALRRRSAAALAAAPIALWLQLSLYDANYLASGYVDTGVSFLVLVGYYLVLTSERDLADDRGRALLVGVAAGAGGLAKQPGVAAALAIGALVVLAGGPLSTWRRRIVPGLLAVLVAAAIIGPWFGVKEWQIATGADASEAEYIQRSTSSTLSARLDDGWAELANGTGLGRYGVLALVAVAFVGLARQPWAGAGMLVLAVPWTLVWAGFLSYDRRNFAVTVPHWALALAVGLAPLGIVAAWALRRLPLGRGALRGLAVGLVLAGVALMGLSFWEVDIALGPVSITRPGRYLARVWIAALVVLGALAARHREHAWPALRPRAPSIPLGLLVVAPAVVIAASALVGDDAVRAHNRARRIAVGTPQAPLNGELAQRAEQLEGLLATPEGLARSAPGIGRRVRVFREWDRPALERLLADERVHWLLMTDWQMGQGPPGHAAREVLPLIAQRRETGQLRLHERFAGYHLFAVRR